MTEKYKLSVDECEKLIGHCWNTSVSVFPVQSGDYEETAKRCPHCGLREIRKVVTTYRFEGPQA